MEFFIVFDITVFIILAILFLAYGLSVISNIETFVEKNMDYVIIISVVIAVIMATVIYIIMHISTKKFLKSFIRGNLSLFASSQLIYYIYRGIVGIATHGTLARIFLFIFSVWNC